jgi:hypothetical protein
MKRILCLTVVAALVAASVALAAASKVVKGGTYTGTIRQAANRDAISFKVSKNGKRVASFKVPGGVPFYCQGGGFPVVTGGSGTVSKKGTFTAKLQLTERDLPPKGAAGFVLVTGKFGSHGTVSGKVKTDPTDKTFTKCGGTSPFSAKT